MAMSHQQLIAELAKAQAENEALRAKVQANRPKLRLKVSDKGGISLYGLGRFPVTLYKSQWEALLSVSSQIQEFINTNSDSLKEKDEPITAKASLVDSLLSLN